MLPDKKNVTAKNMQNGTDKQAEHYIRCCQWGLISAWFFVLWMLWIGVWASAPR